MDRIEVAPIGRVSGAVRVPGSKSLSNRALLVAALASGTTRVAGVLDAEDTRMMRGCLESLGVGVRDADGAWVVEGCGGRFPVRQADLFVGNSGTTVRPLTAAVAFSGGTYRVDGVARMRERPIGDLVESLNALGAEISYAGKEGFPPLWVRPPKRRADAVARVRGTVSSQFLTGLLMAAPVVAPAGGMTVAVDGELISRPYVEMTAAVMRAFGADVREEGGVWRVAPTGYRSPGTYAVEADASSASYFLALGALAGGPVRVLGIGGESLQGDARFSSVLERMGARVVRGAGWTEVSLPEGEELRGLDFDASEIPDAAMTLAVMGLFTKEPVLLRGIASWRVKETDRIEAMAAELVKFGAGVESGPDWIRVSAPEKMRPAQVATYRDHRMAMALSLAACGDVAVTVEDPGCVAKTFPEYFPTLGSLVAGGRQ